MADILLNPEIWASLLTLTALEIVLGVDNLVFIAIVAERLPPAQRQPARRLGLAFALLTRLALLATIAWLAGLTAPVFSVYDHPVSWRDIVLALGGIFLIAKATSEIHGTLEASEKERSIRAGKAAFGMVILQIGILDIVFSLDSVITAVGLVREYWIMATAILIAIVLMMVAAEPLSNFVNRHPTIRMLALAFLVLIGTVLVAEGAGFHLPRGYIYFAMAFSVAVEALNILVRRRQELRSRDGSDSGG